MSTDADLFLLSLLFRSHSQVFFFFWLITLWAIWKCKSEGMLEGKAVNAFQALNYCKHMVMICQEEAVPVNHFLRSFIPPVCNWTQFVDC